MSNLDQDQEDSLLSFEITQEDESFKRLDLYLVEKLPDLSRSLIKKLFEKGKITSNEGKVELKKPPKAGQIIKVELPEAQETQIVPQDIPLDILFEDEHLIIINKQAGLVIHPGAGNWDGTLVNAILHHCPDLKGIGHEKRPGIVHRLDKGTTGVMVVAKAQKAHEKLVEMFSKHDLKRKYEAVVVSVKMPMAGKIETLIGRHPNNRLKMSIHGKQSKEAKTFYKVLKQFECLTHMEFTLETGRTHQIRVHSTEVLKAALLCDYLYGNLKQQFMRIPAEVKNIVKDYEHPLLHAKLLEFNHPITGELLSFTTPAPEPFKSVVEVIYEQ